MIETWSNGPGEVYAAHSHPYHKTLKDVRMKAGDVLELPPGTVHSAVVGPDGVECSEAHRD
jgi:quercetin dioxygenase-like cupin family protein